MASLAGDVADSNEDVQFSPLDVDSHECLPDQRLRGPVVNTPGSVGS